MSQYLYLVFGAILLKLAFQLMQIVIVRWHGLLSSNLYRLVISLYLAKS